MAATVATNHGLRVINTKSMQIITKLPIMVQETILYSVELISDLYTANENLSMRNINC